MPRGIVIRSEPSVVGDPSHDGTVNVSTTPQVGYTYADGSENTIPRTTGMVYPNGRVVSYGYGTAGGIDDRASRIASIIDDDDTHLVDYSYLGRQTFVAQDDTEPQMKWTLVDLEGTDDPDTGDIYSGLDRFGRVKDNRWYNYDALADVDRIQYGYDRAGNRIWRRNTVAAALGKEFDEIYVYDGVHRLQEMVRGTLNTDRTALTSETFAQCWSLDSTGNWQGFREDTDGNGAWDLVQSRTANAVNEIANLTKTVGSAWASPAYNRAGNMTTMPKPADPTQGYTATYDAWNRLVKIEEGEETVSQYAYDGAKRRILQLSYDAGILDETRHLYYTEPSRWQVLEERMGTSPDAAAAERQFVWGMRYIDDLVVRDRDTNDDGSMDERLYAMQDANWNVTGIVDEEGVVQERYTYSAYGVPVWLSPAFVPQLAAFDSETLYCGYRYADQIECCFVRNRHYLPITGSWTQRDPLIFVDSMALHAYARANPIAYTDPSGLSVGIQTKGYCCVRRSPLSPWCICVDWEVDFGANFRCCRNGAWTLVNEFKVCISVGYYWCFSKNIGFWSQYECRITPASKRGGIGPVVTPTIGACPQAGCSGRVCAQASYGYAARTVGVRVCYGDEGYTFEFGYGIGTGIGIGGGGCINCVS